MKKQLLILILIGFVQNVKSQIVSDTFNTQTQSDPYQTFTVPCGVTSLTINAVGASGGALGALFGRGARMIGTFSVTPGDVLRLRAGRYGVSGGMNGVGGAGGGASWVINQTTNQVLIVAGGGGGSSINPNNTTSMKVGGNATITNSGTNGGETGLLTNKGGGGGGWITNGGGGMIANLGGKSYTNGGAGAVGSSSNASFNAGGFGGGGGGAQYLGMGGGGGGYSGGIGGSINSSTGIMTSSQGGGSFNGGTNQVNSVGQLGPQVGSGTYNGQIIISYLDPLGKPIILGNNAICSGETTTLSVQSPTTGYTYYWSNGTNGTSIIVNQGGIYTVYATSTCGTSQVSNNFNLIVNTPPTAAVSTTSPSAICEGGSALLTANIGANLNYQWLNNGINISGATSTSYSAILSGSYKVIVSDGFCSDTSNAISIVVNPIPVINVTSDNSVNYCGNIVIQNILTSTQAQSYLWNTGDTTQSIVATSQGTYSVAIVDANGCQNTDSIQITVNPLLNVFAGNDQTTCQGQSVTLNGSGANTYSWNNSVTNNTAFTPSSTNTYIVLGTDANGCQGSDTVLVTVNQNTSSTITQTADNSYTLNGQTYTQSGTYSQVIPNANGCDSTITLNLTINNVGLDEVSNSTISIYPNPASNQITIAYADQIQKVEIMDAKGAKVYSSIENKKDIVLPSTMQTGYYMLLVHTQEGVFRKELVVNK